MRTHDGSSMPPIMDFAKAGLRRSGRVRSEPDRFGFASILRPIFAFGVFMLAAWSPTPSSVHSFAENSVFAAVNAFNSANQCFDGTHNGVHFMALLAGKENNESYTFREMMKQDDRAAFVEAMQKEVLDHESRHHWDVVLRSDKPPDEKTIMAIWSFKRKRFPDGRLNKHKARLCAHGGMQTWGVNYWETYAPTVNWISVRFLLIVAEILQLETRAIDFVLAFPQAKLETPVYMELPAGVELSGHSFDSGKYLLRLRMNLYGLWNASYNWHQKLKTALEERGFVESLSDPCVFLSKNMVILQYVDDCILISRDGTAIQSFITSLEKGSENFIFTDEGAMNAYLGVEISRLPNGDGFTLTQPFLIDRVIQALNFDPTTTKGARDGVPASYPLLSKDENGLPRKADWKYRSLIGMLGYLQGTTRPDIAMAVHQCARFNSDPKLSHERAVEKIGRYLLDTKDKGIIYKPDTS